MSSQSLAKATPTLSALSAPSFHEAKILAHFGQEKMGHDGRTRLPVEQSVFICFTNRCGSFFLADLMANTGRFPQAGEFLNSPSVISRSEKWECENLMDFFLKLSARVSKHGVFSTKVSSDQLLMLYRWGYMGTLFPNPKFIWIERTDVLAQAISYSIAAQTKQWRSDQKTATPIVPEYRFDDILKRIRSIAESNARFATILNMTGSDFFRIGYEGLTMDPSRLVREVLDWLDISLPDTDERSVSSALRKQANDMNAEFRKRFIEEVAARPELFGSQREATASVRGAKVK